MTLAERAHTQHGLVPLLIWIDSPRRTCALGSIARLSSVSNYSRTTGSVVRRIFLAHEFDVVPGRYWRWASSRSGGRLVCYDFHGLVSESPRSAEDN
ncbi:hypothetical protein HNQ60_000701 [Povalibacter uvarum]|uniref:Uncharacterized protein n=1 Tax=Povalibacter uvarum TaxID=732238 RepID=A0A841HIH0_9GAMM|nr:hypothetical protein [Povalibacter uvarum]